MTKPAPCNTDATEPSKCVWRSALLWAIIPSLIIALFLELYVQMTDQFNAGNLTYAYDIILSGKEVLRSAAILLITWLIVTVLRRWKKPVGRFCFSYRWAIGIAIVVIAVALGLNGSSLSIWNVYTGDGYQALLGISRTVRSDEWAKETAMNISQSFGGYDPVSQVIRGAATDTRLGMYSPSWSFVTFFRPFMWGYLLMGTVGGLSFFWAGRMVVLFLVTFEWGRIITHDNRLLSVTFAVAVSFSPLVEWWFAINALVEMLIFGQLLCIACWHIVRSPSRKVRLGLLAGAAYVSVGFIWTLYPSWEIPLFWVFLASVVWALASGRKEASFGRAEAVGMVCTWLVVVGGSSGLVVYQSYDAIMAWANTVYPGVRDTTQGSLIDLFRYVFNPSLPYDVTNVSETTNSVAPSSFYCLFPAGTIFGIYSYAKHRDGFLLANLIVEAVLLVFVAFGLPSIIAQVLLLTQVLPGRETAALGLIELMLLVRALSISADDPAVSILASRRGLRVAIAAAFALTVSAISFWCYYDQSVNVPYVVVCVALLFLLVFLLTGSGCKKSLSLFCACLCSLTVVTGLAVNPVIRGTNGLTETDTYQKVRDVVSQDSEAKWVFVSGAFYSSDYLIMDGARTVSSIAPYPDGEQWKDVFGDSVDESVYSRSGYIDVELTEGEPSAEVLPNGDYWRACLNDKALEQLNVTYVASMEEQPSTLGELKLDLVSTASSGLRIYMVSR